MPSQSFQNGQTLGQFFEQLYGTECHDLIGYMDPDGVTQDHHRAISGHAFLIDGGAV